MAPNPRSLEQKTGGVKNRDAETRRCMLFLFDPLTRTSHMTPTSLQGRLGNVEEVMESLVSTKCADTSPLVWGGLDGNNIYYYIYIILLYYSFQLYLMS